MGRVTKKVLAYVVGAYIGTGLINGWNPHLWRKADWVAMLVVFAMLFVVTEAWRWWKARR